MTSAPPQERVLSTLNKDGTRRWLRPTISSGRFLEMRRVVAYALILLFAALPWIKIGGIQSVLLDIPRREFTFFGMTFLPTDTLPFMLMLAGVFVTIFLVTALFGRLWCGWACPQTVYLEFIYRPLERLLEGAPDARGRRRQAPAAWRTLVKYVVYLIVSLVVAHIFLAYFVPVETLFGWMGRSPFEHPTAFLVMASVTGLMMFDFCFFREQVCIVACPYGRFQSVMLDRDSVIISYDETRGEPRGRLKRGETGTKGDCVDCGRCVVTCPTGIDIRQGLQMECIGCAQCIDACDDVMDKISRPRGLIRYSSQNAMERKTRHVVRPRVVLYPLLLLAIGGLLTAVLLTRASADVSLLREGRQAYQRLETGDIANNLRVKIVNRARESRTYRVGVGDTARLRMDTPFLTLDAGGSGVVHARIILPPDAFELGRATVIVSVDDDVDLSERLSYRVQGPFGGGGGGEP